jgi:hypothetical protein
MPLLLAPLALGQPVTYTVPIVARTPVPDAVPGTAPLTETLTLPALPDALDQTLVFGVGGAATVPFRVADGAAVTVNDLPGQVDAIATAPGVMVNGVLSTALAISSGGFISLGTPESNAFVPRNALGRASPPPRPWWR